MEDRILDELQLQNVDMNASEILVECGSFQALDTGTGFEKKDIEKQGNSEECKYNIFRKL